jgi:cytochrome c biogenesis protein CcmG/thiol:disulfide interchange protein DsbE
MADVHDHPVDDGPVDDDGGAAEEREDPRRAPLAPFVAIAVGAVLVLLLVAFARSSGGPKDTAKTPLLGQPAPLVQTTTLDGASFDLATRRGSWVVVNFFGTWCPPCREEHPELVKFADAQSQQSGGAELVTIVNNDDPATVRDWFAKNGGNWPVLSDPNGRIYVSFGVAKVPETWIIDPNGIVRARVITTITADQLEALLAQLQGQPGQ